MAQDVVQDASKKSRDRPKTATSVHGVSQGDPQEAQFLPTSTGNHQCILPSRLFASDGLLRPQDGSKIAQDGPNGSPSLPDDGPRSAQERHKRAPIYDLWGRRWGTLKKDSPLLLSISFKIAPRGPPRLPKGPQETPERADPERAGLQMILGDCR
eukprot:9137801-Pyramimonas_sp.AAC.2